jgi:hypothetical protein
MTASVVPVGTTVVGIEVAVGMISGVAVTVAVGVGSGLAALMEKIAYPPSASSPQPIKVTTPITINGSTGN